MTSKKTFVRILFAACTAVVLALFISPRSFAQGKSNENNGQGKGQRESQGSVRGNGRNEEPTPVGAWFGIARPCPADPVNDSPEHAALCQAVCGECAAVPGALPPEVPMMPTLLADGTVIADDAGEILQYHTTAHGKWAPSDAEPQLPSKQRLQATFLWLQSAPTPGGDAFVAAIRPRFVTYFDPTDPDRMEGYIQPYVFPFVDPNTGLVIVSPPDSSDPLAGNHTPVPGLDPVASPLPPCEPGVNNCLGTYHFTIRRIQPE
jgi:hypothetical protein